VEVTAAIPEQGRKIAVMFRLPIKDGVVAFDQSAGMPVALAHAALMTPGDNAAIKGNGFSPAERNQTPDGLPALFTVGRNFEDGHLVMLLTGLSDNGQWMRVIATVCSFGMLLFGFLLWIRRKMAEGKTEE
jgi:hypothetical protein